MNFCSNYTINAKKINFPLFIKSLLIFGFLLINLSLFVILRIPPSNSYEYSIYEIYPWYFWLFIILSIFIGQITLLMSIISKSRKNIWIFGFLLIMIPNSILLFLPLIRGYFFYGGQDTFSHIGYMLDITNNSVFGANHYPADHILGVIISYVSNITSAKITMFLPQLFSYFSILSWYLIGKQIFKDQSEFILLIIFSSMLVFKSVHIVFTPYTQSLFLIPSILYLFFKTNRPKNRVMFSFILVLYCIVIVFYHPLSTILLILSFLLLQIAHKVYQKLIRHSNLKINTYKLILISLIIFSMWSTYLYKLVSNLMPIINSLVGVEEVGESQFQMYSSLANSVQMDYFDLVKLCLNSYGQYVCLGVISVFCSIYLILFFKDHLSEVKYYHVFSSIGFIFFLLLTFIVLFAQTSFIFERFFTYSLFFSFILIPSSLHLILKHSRMNEKLLVIFVLCLLLLPTLYFSTFNLYASPKTKLGNYQVSISDFNGIKTFFDTRNESIPILELGISQLRYHDSIYGREVVRRNIRYGQNLKPVDHFGTKNESLSSFYDSSHYFLLNSAGKYFYPNIYPEFREKWRFIPEDFYKLSFDKNIYKVYSNNNLEVFIINGLSK